MQGSGNNSESDENPFGHITFLNQLHVPLNFVESDMLLQGFSNGNFDSSTLNSLPLQTNNVSSSQEKVQDFDIIDEECDEKTLINILTSTMSEGRPPLPDFPSYNFGGDYGFDIDFNFNTKENNKHCIYSDVRNKLYVSRDFPCVINFKVNSNVPNDAKLRVTSTFAKPEDACWVVQRCITDAVFDIRRGVKYSDHIIRCDNSDTLYVKNHVTNRRSLLIPFKNPSAGFVHSTYVFKFTCLSSCPGGINRKPIKVIFTLERFGKVIGRRSVEVKICSSPKRDCSNEDGKKSMSLKRALPLQQAVSQRVSSQSTKDELSSNEENINGVYMIRANNEQELKELMDAKKFYKYYKMLGNIEPHVFDIGYKILSKTNTFKK